MYIRTDRQTDEHLGPTLLLGQLRSRPIDTEIQQVNPGYLVNRK